MKSCYVLLTDPISSVFENPAFAGADEVIAGEYIRQNLSVYRPGVRPTIPKFSGLFIGDGLQMKRWGKKWAKEEKFLFCVS